LSPTEKSAQKTPIVLLLLTLSIVSIALVPASSTHTTLNNSSSNQIPQYPEPPNSTATQTSSSITPSFSSFPAWTNATPIPSPREGYGAAEVKGVFYYMTGFGRSGDSVVNEAYNGSSNTWTTKAPLPSAPRSETVAVTDGSYIYLIGGRPVATVGNDLWRYNPANDSWTSLTPMPTARATEHMAVYYNGRIYVAGGRTTGAPSEFGDLSVMEIYDVASSTWTSGTPMPQPVADGYAVLLNGRIYILAGLTLNAVSRSTFIYDISSDTWSTGAPSPNARIDPAVGICGPLIYMIGGDGEFAGLQTSNYAYNPVVDNWTSSLPIPTPTAEVQAISYKDQIFVISGGIFGSGGGNPANQVFHCTGNTLYISPPAQPAQSSGTKLSYQVKVAKMQPLTGWDVSVRTNQSIISPTNISISGNLFQTNFGTTVTTIANCINGQGIGCVQNDGPGIAHSAGAILGHPPLLANSTLDGLLFTITYTAGTGKFSPVTIIRDTLANGTAIPVLHTTMNAIYGTPPPDFGLSAFPRHVFVGQGSSATTSIFAQSLNSFAGNITLSATISPSGATLSTFSKNPISLAANQTRLSKLTISTNPSTALGNYTLNIFGQAASLSHSITITVIVVPDFSITASPDSFKVTPGTRISSTITLTSKGFAGFVSLATFTAPTNFASPQTFLNQSFLTLSQGGSAHALMTIYTFLSTPPGNYTITVTASSAILSHIVTISLDIPAPTLTITPSKGPAGTKIVVQGSNFPYPQGSFYPDTVYVSFDDIVLSTAPIPDGTFTLVLDVPQAQAGTHMIKAHDYYSGAFAQASFLVTPTPSPLNLAVQVGAVYFPGDSAVISILATQGSTVGPSGLQLQIFLLKPDGTNITLTTTSLTTGLFRASYSIPKTGPLGTYAILAKARLSGQQTSALQTFEVKLSWLSSNAGNITGAVTVAGVRTLANISVV